MVKNKSRLAIKLFIIVWIVLAIHVTLKLTFNYWQPYVIPNDKLQIISDFIDSHNWLKVLFNAILYLLNGVVLILCGLRQWWFQNKKHIFVFLTAIIVGYIYSLVFKDSILNTIVITIILPIIIDKNKWLSVLITFALTNVFLFLSLWLEGFTNADNMNYIIAMFLNFDYYIMLVLNYFVFNLAKKVK